jgi:uncharacterized protein (TIGR03067 family)
MKTVSVAVALVVLGGLVYADEPKAGGPADIRGEYQIVGGQEGAKRIPAAQLKDNTVLITADQITVYDGERKELYTATYKLDAGKTPWVLRMTSKAPMLKDVRALGLIRRDGDTVKLIYAKPGGKAPDDFEPEEKQQLFLLKKRVK